jgi:hypothetical protein
MANPFDFINSITYSKKNLIDESESPELMEKEYAPWMVNKGLSYFVDTVLHANEMNQFHLLDKKLQYDYLINIIRPKKRFSKWAKKAQNDDIDIVKETYGYSQKKAEIALSLLSKAQINSLKQKQEKGGLKK